MTSSLRRFAAEPALAALLAVLSGCGPKDGSKELSAGQAAFDARDYGRAAKAFAQATVLAPGNVDAWLSLARTRLALGEIPQAAEASDRALALSDGDADVRLVRAQVAWHEKDRARAKVLFSSLADDTALPAEIRSQGYSGLGVVLFTDNEYDLARLAFRRAIRQDRRNAAAWYHLALVYRDGFGFVDAALDTFNCYVRIDDVASPRVQRVMRTVLPELKDTVARAAADLPGASRRDSAAAAALITKAEVAVKRGSSRDLRTARQLFADALKADPLSYPAALGLAKAWLATDATRAGQQKALEAYKRACALKPLSVATYLAAGSLAARLGYHVQAVEAYSRAVAANPASLQALDGLVRALRKVGGADKAKIANAYQAYRTEITPSRR